MVVKASFPSASSCVCLSGILLFCHIDSNFLFESIYYIFLYSNILFKGHLLFVCSNMVPSLGPKQTNSSVVVPSTPSKQRRGGGSSAVKQHKFPSTVDNAAARTMSPSLQDSPIVQSSSLFQLNPVPQLLFVSHSDMYVIRCLFVNCFDFVFCKTCR